MRRVRKPREPRGRARYLADDERNRLLEACEQSNNKYLYPVVVLALSTGMRLGEIMNLSWDQIDFERAVIVLHPDQTKNEEARSVPIVNRARGILTELSRYRRIDTKLVFPGKFRAGRPLRPMKIRQARYVAVEQANVPHFRVHDLRHTAASYFAMIGATLAEIAEILGHKTLAIVTRYAHLSPSTTASAPKG